MLALAKQNPFFVIPLPRLSEAPVEAANHPEMKTDEYEMFYLQWLFHPTPTTSSPPSSEVNPEPLPLTTSAIFTPLEEFKKSGEWAQPHLVLTHYPDLAQTHSLVLMRGEISPHPLLALLAVSLTQVSCFPSNKLNCWLWPCRGSTALTLLCQGSQPSRWRKE